MKHLFILRGLPGCGKSSFIQKNGLENFTLSADEIRLRLTTPSLNENGELYIRQDRNNTVFNVLNGMLETRMRNGETTFIDATNVYYRHITDYLKLAKRYNYETFLLEFYHPLRHREVMYNNLTREPYKRVPPQVIDEMALYYNEEKAKINASVNQVFDLSLDPELYNILVERIKGNWEYMLPVHFGEVVVFGDIHGKKALCNWFKTYPYSRNKEYYFLGDYFDRGNDIANAFDLLYDLSKESNVHLIEGNHEKYLRMFAFGDQVKFEEFNETTAKALRNVPKEKIREFLSKMRICYDFSTMSSNQRYNGTHNTFYLNHGGVPKHHKTLSSGFDLVKGAGDFTKIKDVAYAWEHEYNDIIQICGHRGTNKRVNTQEIYEHKLNDSFYCLENEQYIDGDTSALAYLPVMRIHPEKTEYISSQIDENGIYVECVY